MGVPAQRRLGHQVGQGHSVLTALFPRFRDKDYPNKRLRASFSLDKGEQFCFFRGRSGLRFRKGNAKKDRISRKKAVHRLDIFAGWVYNQLQYVMVWPGLSAHGRGLRPGRRQE